MILYFNKNGQLLERLEYGAVPRVGDTTFYLFAYFEGIDLEKYGAAIIRFKRPDLEGSEYPNLFMADYILTYSHDVEASNHFSDTGGPYDNGRYPGYIFNFNSITDNDSDIVKLLDTPGMWEATITLVNNAGGSNVTGLVRFLVEGAVSEADEEEQTLDFSEIMDTFAKAVSGRVGKTDSLYLRFHNDLFTAASSGELLKAAFVKNAYVYDATTNGIYKIRDVHDNTSDTEGLTVYADIDPIFDFSNPNFDSIAVTDMFFVLGNPTFTTVGGLIFAAKNQPDSDGTCVTFIKGSHAIYMASVFANGNENYTISKIRFPFPGATSNDTKGYCLTGNLEDIKDVLLFDEGSPWIVQKFITTDDVSQTVQQNDTMPVSGGGVYNELIKKVDKTQKIAGIDLQDDISEYEFVETVGIPGKIVITATTSEGQGTTYTVQLKTKNDTNVGNSASFNIALDSTIVSGYYSNGNLMLELSTGEEITIPVSDLVSGLASQSDVDNLEISIANLYSSGSTYAVGDLVMYNKRLYRCSTAISTGEAWNSAHWTAVTVEDEINRLQVKTNPFVQMIYNDLYPVGSIYSSTSQNANTASNADKQGCPLADVITGSKWERIKGRFLYGAEDSGITIGTTGGAKSYTLLEANLPAHTHNFSGNYTTGDSGSLSMDGTVDISHTHSYSGTVDSNGSHTHTFSGSGTTSTDGSHVHYISDYGSKYCYKQSSGQTNPYSFTIDQDVFAVSTVNRYNYLDVATATNQGPSLTSNGDHSHTTNVSGTTDSDGSHTHSYSGTTNSGGASDLAISVSGADHTHSFSISGTTTSVGSGTAFSILPPYLAIYMWKRIS